MCDCKYAPSCHEMRQWLRNKFRSEGYEKTVEDCEFYKAHTDLRKRNDEFPKEDA